MRILIAEDEAISRRILESRLKGWGYDVVTVSDGGRAWEVLSGEDPPRLAILDWMMPGMDGVEVCRNVRARGEEPYVYILLLTARTEKDDLVSGMEAGADDYLTKPFDPQELQVRLRAGRRIVDLQGELIQAREELRHQATHDGLTGLWNRAAILGALEREIARALREGKPIGVIMADLDHFKRINDVHGHPAGDRVLREAARRMTAAIRPYDSLGRYGGEEFLAVMPGCDEPCAARTAERLRASLADRAVSLEGEKVSVTLSLGIAAVSDPNDAQAHSLIKAADEALYQAKESGRNRVAIGRSGQRADGG